MIEHIKWLFFDVGSTLVDESAVYESRMRKVAKIANVTYEYGLSRDLADICGGDSKWIQQENLIIWH